MSDSESDELSDGSGSNFDSNDVFNDFVTLGKLTDFKEVVWRFPNTTKCPLSDCKLSCSSRKVCLGHFHIEHADTSIICTLCSELISVKDPLNAFRHHQDKHPNQLPPKLKSTEKIEASARTTANLKRPKKIEGEREREKNQNQERHGPIIKIKCNSHQSNRQSDEDKDVITLVALNITTSWRVPATLKKCPVLTCQLNFKQRSDFVQHYKTTHANGSICCPLCSKPIRCSRINDFRVHYVRVHSTAKCSFNIVLSILRQRMPQTPKKNENNSQRRTDAKIDDLITLSGGKKITTFPFPKGLTECPAQKCFVTFNNRAKLLEHFKSDHAPHSYFCEFCKKLISVHTTGDLTKHCRTKTHQEMESQKKSNENKPVAKNVQYSKALRQKQPLPCPLTDCSYKTMQMAELCTHWNRKHGELKFPEYRDKSKFINIIDAINFIRKPSFVDSIASSLHNSGHTISISSASKSSKEDIPLRQKSQGEKRKRSSFGSDWLTSDVETDLVQDGRKCKKTNDSSRVLKLSRSEPSNVKQLNSYSSSVNDQVTGSGNSNDMSSRQKAR